MRKQLKTFTVLIACNVSAYKAITVRAKSVEDAESRVMTDFTNKGFESHYNTDDGEQWKEDWEGADDLRVVENVAEEVAP